MYTIWVPFELAPNNEFNLDKEVRFETCGYPSEIIKQLGYTGLRVEELPTEEAARALLPGVNAALLYAAVGGATPMTFGWEPVPLEYKDGDPLIYWRLKFFPDDPPAPFNASRTAIYPSDRRLTDGQITIGMTGIMPPARFVEAFQKGLTVPSLQDGTLERRIRFGGELYGLSHFEASDRARFLTLCTALEVIAPRLKLPERIRAHIDRWVGEARELECEALPHTKELEALTSLTGGLASLMRTSITASLKEYVQATLSGDDKFKNQSRDKAMEVARLYGLRGKVVHNGADVHPDDLIELDEIVRMTLIAAMRSQTIGEGS